MIKNINLYRDKFIDIPTGLIEKPKTVEDWKNNAYYMIGTFFKSFTDKDLFDLFNPEYFYYDDLQNLYFCASISQDSFFDRFIFKNDDKTRTLIAQIKADNWCKIDGKLTINYCLTNSKILLTINSYDFKNEHIKSEVDVDISNRLNYNWMLNWYEYKETALNKVKEVCTMFDTHPFIYIHDLYMDKYREAKHDYSLVRMPISYKVIAGLIIQYQYKTFDITSNTLFYRNYPQSNKRYYVNDDSIIFDTLFRFPNKIVGFTEDFVKECVAYQQKKKIRAHVNELSKDVQREIKDREDELKELKDKLKYNQPAIDKLKDKMKSIKAENIEFNLNES